MRRYPATCYSFPHLFTMHLLEQGAEIRAIQELMGHSNLNITKVYNHVPKRWLGCHSRANRVSRWRHAVTGSDNYCSI
jgi:site-specific recombinase XerD